MDKVSIDLFMAHQKIYLLIYRYFCLFFRLKNILILIRNYQKKNKSNKIYIIKEFNIIYLKMKEQLKQVQAIIISKTKINHDCYIFSFAFTKPNQIIKFTIAQHFKIVAHVPTYDHPQGQMLKRCYTPINLSNQAQAISFLVKIYRPYQDPHYPLGGKYTPYLENQEVGDKLIIEGPYGQFNYLGKGQLTINDKQFNAKRLFFMAGGSGISPIFQTILEISQMKGESIQMILLYANQTQEDITLRKQLQNLSHRVKIYYVLADPPNGWPYYKGNVTQNMLKSICPLDDKQTLYIHCGHKFFKKKIISLFATKYPKSTLFKY